MSPSIWQQFEEEKRRFSLLNADYDFFLPAQPKQRSHGHTKQKTRTWERTVFEAAGEQAPEILPTGRIGMEIMFLAQKPIGDLSNCIKTLEDALNRRAYKDDRQIDYLTAVRKHSPEVEQDRVSVKIYEIKI